MEQNKAAETFAASSTPQSTGDFVAKWSQLVRRKRSGFRGGTKVNIFSALTLYLTNSKGMAERVGFEPTVGVSLHTLSKRAP